VGLVQDFAEALLSGVLSRFAKLNPDTQLQVRVAGSAELLELLSADRLDVVLCMASAEDPAAVKTAPMAWFGDPDLVKEEVLPLAVLEEPCRFRDAALGALKAAGRPYRIVLETPSLSALRAAVDSDLAITCRTDIVLKRAIGANAAAGLPPLPQVSYARHTRAQPHPTIARLADVISLAALEL
jgi:DNA-binding transcriptional LysR family regulator